MVISTLYILFLYIDIFNVKSFVSSNVIKYISIILCFGITILIGEYGLDKKDTFLLQTGFFITIFADLCFLIFDYYILGIIFFCLVQVVYYNRYKGYKSYRSPLIIARFIIVFLLIISIYLILNLFIVKIDFLFAIALVYSIYLLSSIIESIKAFKNNLYPFPNKHIIVLGMVLFLLCDINVAISSVTKEFATSVHDISKLLIWIFYLPSQVLLSLSGYKFKENRK